jgi:polyisoprenoid-binding protein YceI
MRFFAPAAIGLALAMPVCAAAAPSLDPAKAPAGHYELDRRHTAVLASVLHEGVSHFIMRLDQVSGAYDYDPANPRATKISITMDARSLDAGDAAINKQFADQFLDASHNPQITFTSTAIRASDATHGQVTGQLTFHGVTRPVTLQVAYNGFAPNLILGSRMGFSASTVIRRSDFGSNAWEGPVGDDVRITIETEFVHK